MIHGVIQSIASPAPPRRDRQSGMSLVEVLVVLAIIGVVAGVSVLSLGGADRGGRAETEARRLADRLQLAADEVLVTGDPRALVWDARSYRFVVWDRQAAVWRDDARALLGSAHVLPAALALEGAGDDGDATEGPVLITPDLAQPPVALAVAGAQARWRVRFDGFAATAIRVAP